MGRPGTLPTAAIAGAILCLLILYAVWNGLPGGVPPTVPGAPSEPSPPTEPGTPTRSNGTQIVNGLTYATKNVRLPGPSGTTSWTYAISVAFENVMFCLWTVGWGSYSGVTLEGTALEPNGARMGFAFSPYLGFPRWMAPDGVFGVGGLNVTSTGANVTLYVAKPMLPYGYLAVLVEYPAPDGTPVFRTLALEGVLFNLSVQHNVHGGPWLIGSAQMPNGTVYAINMSAGGAPLVACSVIDSGIPNYWGSALCREWMSVGRYVGVLWNGGTDVGLLVLETTRP